MRAFLYFDGSALAKHYTAEKGTAIVDQIIGLVHPKQIVISIWGVAEVVAVLNRKRNVKSIAADEFALLMVNLLERAEDFWDIKADSEDVRTSFPLIVEHNINATDALHLHLALKVKQLVEQFESMVGLVTSDQRLLKAAKAEGLTTIDPEQISEGELKKML
ncbi:MAG: type II toxin-antitoxin system VapC family toxin [Chloroflexi bacterium]|nr:type II toxin-antitoxin system VapC family toxin [Chloroflexota bacterium]